MKKLLMSISALACGMASCEVKPFSLDLYVKDHDIGHHIFRGTRAVSWGYPEAGWSIGIMKIGELTFAFGDGKNHSFIRLPASDTNWRNDEWNHLAASYSNNVLALWVNGVKAKKRGTHLNWGHGTNVCCVTSYDSPRAVITNGYDAMSANWFTGKVKDFRFFDRVMPDAEIAMRAKAVPEMRRNDPDRPPLAPDEKGIDVAEPLYDVKVPLTIQPTPQMATVSPENVALKGPYGILADDTVFAKTAADTLRSLLADAFGVAAVKGRQAKGTTFRLVTDGSLGREEYRLEGGADAGGFVVKVSSSGRAFHYGIDTLRQLMRIRSLENGRQLSLPKTFSVSDWPLMPYRLAILDLDYADAAYGRKFALGRLNAMWFGTMKPDATEGRIKAACDLLRPYGVDVVSGFGYNRLRRPYTFSDPETLKAYKAHIDKLGRAGVKGLMFMFDDLSGPALAAWQDDPAMKKRFRNRAAFQNALIHKGFDYADAYPNLHETFYSVCPTYYSRGWGEIGRKYYADFSKGFRDRSILMHHCAFGTENVARLKADGAETYCYYLNGLWPSKLFFSWFICPESYRWSWYTWTVDLNGVGPKVNPEAIEGVRSLHTRSPLFWSASSSLLAVIQTGIVSWNPPAYDPDKADKASAQAYFGSGVYEPLKTFETALMPIVGYLVAFRTGDSFEWDLQVVPRRANLSRKEIRGYLRNFAAAEKACRDVEAAIAAQDSVFDLPDLVHPGGSRGRVTWLQKAMRKTLDAIRNRLPEDL